MKTPTTTESRAEDYCRRIIERIEREKRTVTIRIPSIKEYIRGLKLFES